MTTLLKITCAEPVGSISSTKHDAEEDAGEIENDALVGSKGEGFTGVQRQWCAQSVRHEGPSFEMEGLQVGQLPEHGF